MRAKLIKGKPIADAIKDQAMADIRTLGRTPKLVGVVLGDNAGAKYYAANQEKACREVGIAYELHELPRDSSQKDLEAHVAGLNADPAATGVILLMPLPEGIDSRHVQQTIHPDKDVEGLTPPTSAGSSMETSRWARARPTPSSPCSATPGST